MVPLVCPAVCPVMDMGLYRTERALHGHSICRDCTPGLVIQQSFDGPTCLVRMGGSILNTYKDHIDSLYYTLCARATRQMMASSLTLKLALGDKAGGRSYKALNRESKLVPAH